MSQLLSLVIPCYNEEESLPSLHKEVTRVCSGVNEDYEIIYINDGSSDNTLHTIKSIAEKDNHVVYYSLSRNFGKEAALYTGLC